MLALTFGGLELRGVGIRDDTEGYIASLVAQGVARMAAEGAPDNRGFARAVESLTQVVAEAEHRMPVMADGSLGEVTAATVEEVVAFLCPGIWPFC